MFQKYVKNKILKLIEYKFQEARETCLKEEF